MLQGAGLQVSDNSERIKITTKQSVLAMFFQKNKKILILL